MADGQQESDNRSNNASPIRNKSKGGKRASNYDTADADSDTESDSTSFSSSNSSTESDSDDNEDDVPYKRKTLKGDTQAKSQTGSIVLNDLESFIKVICTLIPIDALGYSFWILQIVHYVNRLGHCFSYICIEWNNK